MKNLFAFLSILAMMVLPSCSDHPSDTDASLASGNTALDLYYRYAGNENLTVAYLGDFSLNGNKIDALMIQVNIDDDWGQLVREFGMLTEEDSLRGDTASAFADQTEDEKTVSVGVDIDADFVADLGLDTITDLSQVDDERFNRMTEIIANKIRDIVVTFEEDKDIDMDAYIDTLAVAVARQLLNEVLMRNEPDSTKVDAYDYGHSGYVSVADESNHTIWLFFYDSPEECDNILTHIKKEIIFSKRIYGLRS